MPGHELAIAALPRAAIHQRRAPRESSRPSWPVMPLLAIGRRWTSRRELLGDERRADHERRERAEQRRQHHAIDHRLAQLAVAQPIGDGLEGDAPASRGRAAPAASSSGREGRWATAARRITLRNRTPSFTTESFERPTRSEYGHRHLDQAQLVFEQRARAHGRREVEAVRQRIEALERVAADHAHAARGVLHDALAERAQDPGEDAVADRAHQRHLAVGSHARAEHQVGALLVERAAQLGEDLRVAGAVGVEEARPGRRGRARSRT